MHQIKVKNIALAAYIKANGVACTGVENGHFVLASNRPAGDWRIEYINSEAFKVDQELLGLKKLLRNKS